MIRSLAHQGRMASRQCAECGHRASERARFCERCGAALTPSAAPLRAPSALEARILEQRTGIEGERKQVTVMYTDIVGSMALTHALDAERWGLVLDRFLAIAAGAVHAFEGTVNQFTGDGLLAVFGAPLAHEDHARRACLAVLELQRQVAGLAAEVARSDGVEFAIRCGLNSGEVVVGAIGDDVHMDFVPIGNTTALGKRIESLAPAGSTAISASTAALVEGEFVLRELGEFEVKGARRRQRVLELVGPGPAQTRLAAMAATRGLSRFVGRDAERAALETALEHALAGDGRAVGIVGDPGVGKSRLVHEFVADCAARGLYGQRDRWRRARPLRPVPADARAVSRLSSASPSSTRPRSPASGSRRRCWPSIRRSRRTCRCCSSSSASRTPSGRRRRWIPRLARAGSGRERRARRGAQPARGGGAGRRGPALARRRERRVRRGARRRGVGTRTLVVGTYRPEYEAAWTNRGRTPSSTSVRSMPTRPTICSPSCSGATAPWTGWRS